MAACVAAGIAMADTIPAEGLRFAGPFPIVRPLVIDQLDVNSKPYSIESALSLPANLSTISRDAKSPDGKAFKAGKDDALAFAIVDFSNASLYTPEIIVEGPEHYRIYVDGEEISKEMKLRPGTHQAVVKYIVPAGKDASVKVKMAADKTDELKTGVQKRLFTLGDVLHGPRISGTEISPDGKYLITAYSDGQTDGTSRREWRVTGTDGRPVATSASPIAWMPRGASFYRTEKTPEGLRLIVTDASTGRSETLAGNLPDQPFEFLPDGTHIIIKRLNKGPKEDEEVYRILEPEDRQPGWRDRTSLELYDLKTGVSRQLTFGNRNVNLLDISADGRKLLLLSPKMRYEKRPTTLFTIYTLDLETMKSDTVVADDGFVAGAVFSPDVSKALIMGSPEALGGIGKNVPQGRIPSMYDYQLYIRDIDTGDTRAMTRDFNPAVSSFKWSRADGNIYFNANDRDCLSLFRLNPSTGKIDKLPVPQDLVKNFSLPLIGNEIALHTQSADNPDRLYVIDSRSGRSRLLDEPLKEQLADVNFGTVEAWDFVNSVGDTICGRFYLPPNFDPSKKYPLIVNYYGGCTPTERSFESRYPHHAYAAQGYVVYVVEPSGATGFGQEFSSRHVNTAGTDPARDIIEGTKKFCETHPYVDPKKIGCIGASYGGFMTQYLQTVTDIFAAAISHAGISDHTSYWGEGYWGYSYSEVSMANSYPWSERDLYVGQSPLYNADKIHTPLLFLHGDADLNVPVGESIQMFTALKLLGRPTAFVAVKDQDHHILDHDKRIKWQDSIFAWFARYLKDDPSWWESLYPDLAISSK